MWATSTSSRVAKRMRLSVAPAEQSNNSSGGDKTWPVQYGRARYLLAVEYDGSSCTGGAQRQQQRSIDGSTSTQTVQGELERALSSLLQAPQAVVCGSRTDAGVHSLCNYFHVDAARASPRKPGKLLKPHTPEQLVKGTNHFLKGSGVRIRTAYRVDSRCHARFSAKERVYAYRLVCGADAQRPSIFQDNKAWFVPAKLDVDAMNSVAKELQGYHDFSTFRGSGCQANSPLRTLDELSVARHEAPLGCGDECELLLIRARARSFLYRQVRFLVGALKEAGMHQLTPARARELLHTLDQRHRPQMAPGHGLFLQNVHYPHELFTSEVADGWPDGADELPVDHNGNVLTEYNTASTGTAEISG